MYSFIFYRIPDEVTSIGNYAFGWCINIAAITIGESVALIGEGTFEECRNVTSLFCKAKNPPLVYESTFPNWFRWISLYVPETAIGAYETARIWKDFSYVMSIEGSGIDALGCEKLEEAIIYDLQGRRITDALILKKGIYIINGLKVVINN